MALFEFEGGQIFLNEYSHKENKDMLKQLNLRINQMTLLDINIALFNMHVIPGIGNIHFNMYNLHNS